MRSRFFHGMLVLFLLVCFAGTMEHMVRERSCASVLEEYTCEKDEFREQQLPAVLFEKLYKEEDFGEALTAVMLNGHFYPKEIDREKEVYKKYKKEEFYKLCSYYEAVWGDVQCFPLPKKKGDLRNSFFYEDTFGEERNYGGRRIHEGTDIFGKEDVPGYYPILSMTEGTVENIGWLPLGGYRIGIRAPGGAYFYYAHLSEYEKEFLPGDQVRAGEIIGYMGNTGYGGEGTVGKFPVHLHLGIYVKTPHYKELSVNPYWVLKAYEKNMRKYTY